MISPIRSKAFTIIEMMVVIVILGILVSLTIVGYRGWQTGLTQRQAQSDLRIASTAMESAKNFGSGYPGILPPSFKGSDDVQVAYAGGNTTAYCLQATGKKITSIVYYLDSNLGSDPKPGTCSTAYTFGAPTATISSPSSTSIVVSWNAVSGASSYSVKYGTTTPTTTASCTSSPCTISGLSAGTSYVANVTASSTYKTATSANVSTTTPAGNPPAAPSPSAVAQSGRAIQVSWAAVAGATSYSVKYGTTSPTTAASCTSSPCVISGLTASTSYQMNVTATNSYGSTTSATVSATTQTAAGVCTNASYTLNLTGLMTVASGSWSVSYRPTGTTTYTLKGNYPADPPTNGNLSVPFTGLNNRNYDYQVITRDTTASPVGPVVTGTFTAC